MAGRKAVFAINWMEVDALVHARHENPHHILGMHECIDDVYINVYLPDAKIVKIKNLNTKKNHTLVSERVKGFFSVMLKDTKSFPYEVKAKFEDGHEETYIDPYIFEPVIDPIDISRFNEGQHYRIYEKLGAHPMTVSSLSARNTSIHSELSSSRLPSASANPNTALPGSSVNPGARKNGLLAKASPPVYSVK